MTVLEAVLPDESSKAKLVLTRCQPLQPLLGLPHQSTTPEHTVACAASLDTKAVVLRVSLLADNHFSLEYTAPLSAFQALCVALTLCAFSLSQPPMPPSHHPTPTTHTPPNPGCPDAPTSASADMRPGARSAGRTRAKDDRRRARLQKCPLQDFLLEDEYKVERM